MIQRIQTIYLLVAALFATSIFAGNVASYGTVALAASSSFITIALILITISVAIAAIALFKNRKTQLLLCNIGSVTSVVLTLYLAYSNNALMEQAQVTSFDFSNFRLFTPILIMLFFVLAQRAVKKDDDLIKSADRLR
jgi:amino acid transporter